MIRKALEPQRKTGLAGGVGEADISHWTQDSERCPNMLQWATLTMEPGSSVGDHYHHGEAEVYRILSGEGSYNDNGTEVMVGEGDITVCYDAEQHGIRNTGGGPLVFDAIIIKG